MFILNTGTQGDEQPGELPRPEHVLLRTNVHVRRERPNPVLLHK